MFLNVWVEAGVATVVEGQPGIGSRSLSSATAAAQVAGLLEFKKFWPEEVREVLAQELEKQ